MPNDGLRSLAWNLTVDMIRDPTNGIEPAENQCIESASNMAKGNTTLSLFVRLYAPTIIASLREVIILYTHIIAQISPPDPADLRAQRAPSPRGALRLIVSGS